MLLSGPAEATKPTSDQTRPSRRRLQRTRLGLWHPDQSGGADNPAGHAIRSLTAVRSASMPAACRLEAVLLRKHVTGRECRSLNLGGHRTGHRLERREQEGIASRCSSRNIEYLPARSSARRRNADPAHGCSRGRVRRLRGARWGRRGSSDHGRTRVDRGHSDHQRAGRARRRPPSCLPQDRGSGPTTSRAAGQRRSGSPWSRVR